MDKTWKWNKEKKVKQAMKKKESGKKNTNRQKVKNCPLALIMATAYNMILVQLIGRGRPY